MSEKNNQILLDVSSKIDQWLKASDNRSLNLLARRSGQAYAYVYRLSKGDAQVVLHKIAPIIGQVCTPTEAIDFYKSYFKGLSDAATHIYQAMKDYESKNPSKTVKSGEATEYLKDPIYFHVMALCLSDQGCSYNSLIKQLGTSVESLLSELIDKGILKKDEQNIVKFDGFLFMPDDMSTVLSMVKNSCDIFLKTKRNVQFHSEINSWTINAMRRLEAKQKEVLDLLAELRADPTSKGDIKFSYNIAYGRLELDNNDEQTNG